MRDHRIVELLPVGDLYNKVSMGCYIDRQYNDHPCDPCSLIIN
jgi:hypothetical protein